MMYISKKGQMKIFLAMIYYMSSDVSYNVQLSNNDMRTLRSASKCYFNYRYAKQNHKDQFTFNRLNGKSLTLDTKSGRQIESNFKKHHHQYPKPMDYKLNNFSDFLKNGDKIRKSETFIDYKITYFLYQITDNYLKHHQKNSIRQLKNRLRLGLKNRPETSTTSNN